MKVTIAAANGVLSIPTAGLTLTQGNGNQNSRITFEGTLAAINSALANLVYRSFPGFTGFETITISANDEGNSGIGTSLSDTKTLFVNVGGAINNPPTANSDTYSTVRNSPLSVPGTGVLSNDTDTDGPSLSANLVDLPTQGSLSLSPTGSFTYTPNANFTGTDTFTYRATDGISNSNLATVTISVTAPVNNAPVANQDSFSFNENTSYSNSVLLNDTDTEDSKPQTAQLVTGPTHALSFALNADGSFNYTPAANYNGTDSFTYIAKDSAGASSNTATVNLTINPVNSAPIANADSFSVNEDTALSNNVLSNDSDVEDSKPQTAQLITGPTHALSFALNADGSFNYTPAANYNGTDSFSYIAKDSAGASSNTATVSLTVNPVNDAPVAVDDSYTVSTGGTLNNNVLSNDSDVEDSKPQTAQLVTGPTNAQNFVLNPDGTFSYTPKTGVTSDSFTYAAKDSAGATSNTATVSINVSSLPNNSPVAADDSFSVNEDTALSNNVLSNDSDVEDSKPQTAQLITGPTHALSFALNADGSFNYTPAANYNGTDSFSYIAKDSAGASSGTATVNLTINPVNDAPVAVDDSFPSFNEDTPFSGNVLSNDTDVEDGKPQAAQLITGPTHALSFALNPDGSFNYTPAADYNGNDIFTYVAQDSTGLGSNTATVTLSIAPVNDSPIANSDSYRALTDTALNVTVGNGVLVNDTDVDGPSLSVVAAVTTTANGEALPLMQMDRLPILLQQALMAPIALPIRQPMAH